MAVLLLLLMGVIAAQAQPRDAAKNPLTNDPAATIAGRRLFVEKCSACHGPSGEGGHGPSLVHGHSVRRASDSQLYDAIRNGVRGTDMPGFALPDNDIWSMVAFVRSLSAPAFETPLRGDLEAGADIFWSRGGCSGCHMIRGRGGVLGPDLTEVGLTRRIDQLRESLEKPSEFVPRDYRAVKVELRNGDKIEGIAKVSTNYSLSVLDSDGRLHFLDKKQVASAEFREGSLMPDDYAQRLSETEREDVVAFLSRQTLRDRETQ